MLLPESKNKSQKYGCRMLFHSHCVFKDGLALSECLVSNSQFPVVHNLFNFVYLLPLTYSPSSSGTKKNRTSSKIEQNKKMPQQFIKNKTAKINQHRQFSNSYKVNKSTKIRYSSRCAIVCVHVAEIFFP